MIVSLLLALSSLALANGSVTLAWDPNAESDTAGYRVQYGTSSGNYTETIDVGNTISAIVSNLTAETVYFFVVTAYNSASIESLPSNEVSFTVLLAPPPVVISSLGRRKDGAFQLTLTASNTLAATVGWVSVYFSHDLMTWMWLKDVPITSGAVVIADPDAAFVDRRFYRLSFEQTLTIPLAPPPVVISSLGRRNDGAVQLTLTASDLPADPASRVSVYFSNDLATWTWLEDVPILSGTAVVTDPDAASVNRRFYRLSYERQAR